MSYFAKPNFIIYDEWFDDDLEKTKLEVKNEEIKTITNIHEFFYEQSINNIGASENNMQLEIKVNEKQLINKDYLENTPKKYSSLSNKEFQLLKKSTKIRTKFYVTKKLIYSLSIFGMACIFGFLIFFISQYKQNDSRIIDKSFAEEKRF